MPAPSTEWTAEMVQTLPDDGKRYEVLDGVLFVSPAPSWNHQRVVKAFLTRLDRYVSVNRVGDVLIAPADVEFSSRRLLEPDLFVVPLVEGRLPDEWAAVRRLLLVVEVLSPSTARVDRVRKRRIYQSEQVPEYWIVHPEARLVERWRPESKQPEIVDGVLTWQPAADAASMVIDLEALFSEVFGEE